MFLGVFAEIRKMFLGVFAEIRKMLVVMLLFWSNNFYSYDLTKYIVMVS